jgi:hypothetical protein
MANKFKDNIDGLIYTRIVAKLETSPDLLGRLVQSCENENIFIFKSAMKKPIGYIAWIRVCKETYLMMQKTNRLPSYAYENNEGYLPVIYDVVFLPGWEKYCKEQLAMFIGNNRLIGRIRRNKFRSWNIFDSKLRKR